MSCLNFISTNKLVDYFRLSLRDKMNYGLVAA